MMREGTFVYIYVRYTQVSHVRKIYGDKGVGRKLGSMCSICSDILDFYGGMLCCLLFWHYLCISEIRWYIGV